MQIVIQPNAALFVFTCPYGGYVPLNVIASPHTGRGDHFSLTPDREGLLTEHTPPFCHCERSDCEATAKRPERKQSPLCHHQPLQKAWQSPLFVIASPHTGHGDLRISQNHNPDGAPASHTPDRTGHTRSRRSPDRAHSPFLSLRAQRLRSVLKGSNLPSLSSRALVKGVAISAFVVWLISPYSLFTTHHSQL